MEKRLKAVNHDELAVTNNPELARYEIRLGDSMIGLAAYQRATDLIVFTHTEVDDGFEGAGVGSRLVRHALDAARAEGTLVLPLCPFVHAFMLRHAEYADLDYRRHQAPSTAHD
jgi:predicted GNAT family acetyltransferase